MSLSDKDRKLLWARAGNRCSYRFNGETCYQRPVQNSGGTDVVVGEECHIIGDKPGSARYQADYADHDGYANRILLCSPHHTMVDSAPETSTVDTLRRMKSEHEAAVAAASDLPTDRVEIANSEFVTDVSNADRVVGMEVSRPAALTNVKSTVRVRGTAKEAIGFKTTQGLTARIDACPRCGGIVPSAHTGTPARSTRCPHCGEQVPII